VDPRERVQLGRALITKEQLAAVTEALIPHAESFSETEYGGITEFEFKTAVGFEFWKQNRCEWVALEVGLGGRLDATSVVTPRASVIVSIGLDHTQILGDTHAKIAYEKAGIIKPGIPVIIGDMPPEAEEVILGVSVERSAPAWRWGREIIWHERDNAVETPLGYHLCLKPSLVGVVQNHNLALAVAAIDAAGAYQSEEALSNGARLTSIPGRFQKLEFLNRTVILDGAHNADSVKVLVKSLESQIGDQKLILVTNMLSGHESNDFYAHLSNRIKRAHVVPVDFHRATPVPVMGEKLRAVFTNVTEHTTALDGLTAAAEEADPSDVILVTGSFYLVGELIRIITDRSNES
jgi:dihydrofolate synthase/folylpolyglutamate synthase